MLGVLGVFGHGSGRMEGEEVREKAMVQVTKPSRTVFGNTIYNCFKNERQLLAPDSPEA